MLKEHCERTGFPIAIKGLTRKMHESGLVANNPPWDTLTVKARLGILKNDYVKIEKIERTSTMEEFNSEVKPIYGKLRETWERAIEEVVLNEVIKRFSREIQTRRLSKVIDLTQSDYDIIDLNMSKCSTYFLGHDSAGDLNEQLPDAAEILADINTLDTFITAIKNRR